MPAPQVLSDFAFDAEVLDELCRRYLAGELNQESQRLEQAPDALDVHDPDAPRELGQLSTADKDVLRARGVDALRRGEVALLSMAGGMATRFGGGAKACARLRNEGDDTFLSWGCGEVLRLEREFEARVPWVVMTSFATHEAITSELEAKDWFGLDPLRRFVFSQSVLPRVQADASPLYAREDARDWPDTLTCCAPGHGDTLGRLRTSGVLAALREAGVRHLLVANVDNLGATVDPVVVGAHLEAAQMGAQCGVEVVPRQPGEAGGCVARLDGAAQIVESFRLPASTSLDDYPHFNTNTLWFSLDALDSEIPLDWFAVTKELTDPSGSPVECVQFERLIGQATATLRTHFMSVPRALRFVPIKQRADLDSVAEQIGARLENPNQFSLAFS